MKHSILFLLLLFSLSNCFARQLRKDNEKQQFIDAEFFFLNENYDKAVKLYKTLYARDSSNANLAYRIGLCYVHLPMKLIQAIPFLEAATANATINYREGSYKETKANIDVYYFLGYAYQMTHQFDKAIEHYEFYRTHARVANLEYADMALRNSEACARAKQLYAQPLEVEIANLGKTINSSGAELNPCISENDSTLIYTMRTKKDLGKGDISVSQYKILCSHRKSDDKWTRPVDISGQLQTNGTAQTVCLSADGKTLILYRDDYYYGRLNDISGGNLYISHLINGKWQPMQRFDAVNSLYDDTHASISDNGKTVYFSSNRNGGYGGMDLYRVDMLPNGKWSEARNMGSGINTPDDEISPFVVNDSLLYFCSNGHETIGGFDVFVSKKNIHEQWSSPLNLGVPINSPGDESFFAPSLNGKMAYFSMVRPDGYITFGESDIYSLELIGNQPTQIQTNKEKQVLISIHPNNSSHLLDSVHVTLRTADKREIKNLPINYPNNTISCQLMPGNHLLTIESPNYKTLTQTIYIPANDQNSVAIRASLEYKNSAFLRIENLEFNQQTTTLNTVSQTELNRIIEIIGQNPGLYVALADAPMVSDTLLLNKRKQSIVAQLHQNGIEPQNFIRNSICSSIWHVPTNGVQLQLINNSGTNIEPRLTEKGNTDHIRYSILLWRGKTMCDTSQFISYYIQGIPRIFTRKFNDEYISFCGDFENKAQALEMLNKLIDVGFQDAQLIDYFVLNRLSNIEKVRTNPKARFTVLLASSSVALNIPLKEADMVKETFCADGFYRYIIGEFENMQAAAQMQQKAIEQGFVEAFVVDFDSFAKFLTKTPQ